MDLFIEPPSDLFFEFRGRSDRVSEDDIHGWEATKTMLPINSEPEIAILARNAFHHAVMKCSLAKRLKSVGKF